MKAYPEELLKLALKMLCLVSSKGGVQKVEKLTFVNTICE